MVAGLGLRHDPAMADAVLSEVEGGAVLEAPDREGQCLGVSRTQPEPSQRHLRACVGYGRGMSTSVCHTEYTAIRTRFIYHPLYSNTRNTVRANALAVRDVHLDLPYRVCQCTNQRHILPSVLVYEPVSYFTK